MMRTKYWFIVGKRDGQRFWDVEYPRDACDKLRDWQNLPDEIEAEETSRQARNLEYRALAALGTLSMLTRTMPSASTQ